MKRDQHARRSIDRAKRPWLGPCVFAMLFIIGGSAVVSLCLMNDLRLGGGYNVFDHSLGPAILTRVLGVLVPLASLYALSRNSLSRERWTDVALAVCGGLIVHVP